MYADDKTLEVDCLPSLISAGLSFMQTNLKVIFDWAHDAGLCLKAAKCKFMIFGSLHTLKSFPFPGVGLKVNDVSLERVSEFKYLGVWLDDSLQWRPHISVTSAKVLIQFQKFFIKNTMHQMGSRNQYRNLMKTQYVFTQGIQLSDRIFSARKSRWID